VREVHISDRPDLILHVLSISSQSLEFARTDGSFFMSGLPPQGPFPVTPSADLQKVLGRHRPFLGFNSRSVWSFMSIVIWRMPQFGTLLAQASVLL
jgi:hypothetical protein